MILRRALPCLLLLWPALAQAKTASLPDIRVLEEESADIFTILQNLTGAEAALAARDYESARPGFERVLLHDPTLPRARIGLRRCLIALGEIETAAEWIDDPLETDSVLIAVLSGRAADPVRALTTALQRDSDPRLWNALGRIHDAQTRYGAARQAYAMAGLSGQRPGLAQNNIGQSHWLAGDKAAALQAFDQAVSADPTDPRFDNNRRRALVASGDILQALSGLDTRDASVFLAQAGDLAKTDNDLKLARVLYTKSLQLAPRHDPQIAGKLAALEN